MIQRQDHQSMVQKTLELQARNCRQGEQRSGIHVEEIIESLNEGKGNGDGEERTTGKEKVLAGLGHHLEGEREENQE